jgi:hypothetical protein
LNNTFVRLIPRRAKTASALNRTPGPSSNVNTILVCGKDKSQKSLKRYAYNSTSGGTTDFIGKLDGHDYKAEYTQKCRENEIIS